MNFARQIERIQKAHELIRLGKTGSPSDFADKLQISLSQLHVDLDFFKNLHAEVKYSSKKETFYYVNGDNLDFIAI